MPRREDVEPALQIHEKTRDDCDEALRRLIRVRTPSKPNGKPNGKTTIAAPIPDSRD